MQQKCTVYLLLSLLLFNSLIFSCRSVKKDTATTTLTFFTWVPALEYQVNQELVNEFMRNNPSVRIKYINDPTTRAMDKLQTMFAADTPPDVMSIHGGYYFPLAAKGVLHELDDYVVKNNKFEISDFYPSLIEGCRFKTKLYSLPRYTSVYVLFYNKTLFKQAGVPYPDDNWTWQNYLSAASKLTQDINLDGAVDFYGCIIDFWGARIYPWIWQNGGEIFTPGLDKCTLNQRLAFEAIQFLVDLQYKYKVTPRTLPNEYKSNVEMFSLGKIGMYISGAWDIQNLKHTTVDWDVAPLPKGKNRATILGMENYAIARTSKHPDIAWRFLRFLLSKEVQTKMVNRLEKQPSRQSVGKYYLRQPSKYTRRVLVNALQYAKNPPNLPQWAELSQYLQAELDLIWLGKKSVSAGLNAAVEKINPYLHNP